MFFLSSVEMSYEKLHNVFNVKQRYGFSQKVPFEGFSQYGKTHESMIGNPNVKFGFNTRTKLGSEWAPDSTSALEKPLLIQPTAIYYKQLGHIPNYGGHIPGAIFRFGKTYGNDTRDAKRWLRGDFSE